MPEFVWTPLWEGRYEASISLLWKFAWANAFGAGFVRKRFAKAIRETKQNAKNSCVRASGSDCEWRFPFRRPLNEHRLSHFTGDLYQLVVNHHCMPEERRDLMRFCPACLAQGYLSVFHQIACLRLCPIHRCEIIDYCVHCHGSSPYYNEIGEGLRRPYHCLHCGHPLAGTFDPRRFISQRPDLASQECLFEPLENWFTRLRKNIWDAVVPGTRLTLPDFQMKHRREAQNVLSFLNALEPLELDHSLLIETPRPFLKITGDVQPAHEYSSFEGWRNEPIYYELYLALRRHIKRRYLRAHRQCLREVARMEGTSRPASLKDYGRRGICPVALGYRLWQLGVEDYVRPAAPLTRPPELRYSVRPLELDWRYQESDQFWLTRLLVTFFEYVHIVAHAKVMQRSNWKPATKKRSYSMIRQTWSSIESSMDDGPPLPRACLAVFRPKLSERNEAGPFLLLLRPTPVEFQEAARLCPRNAQGGSFEKSPLASNRPTLKKSALTRKSKPESRHFHRRI